MKLAEALIERADLQRRIAQLTQRLTQNAQYQEGEVPAEDPNELLIDYFQTSATLEQLVIAINGANNRIILADGMPMLVALAKRESLKAQHSMLISLANAATPTHDRYSRSEIKMMAALEVKQIRKQADNIAQQHRLLDMQIQQANWLNEL
ncbi:DIP1984 family protein [Actinobacillus vicugnae]|uniref:DIP1984 family protein n=1 Tax=Actinobacillus vicugnae TaxID=2573093 RepID=UPI001240EB0C|nr:DIP1984 family protein [Actinobacillus vicugnae]